MLFGAYAFVIVSYCYLDYFLYKKYLFWGLAILPGGLDGKKSACNAQRLGFDPWVGKIPWKRAWQPTPVFLPGESHGQKSLVGYIQSLE